MKPIRKTIKVSIEIDFDRLLNGFRRTCTAAQLRRGTLGLIREEIERCCSAAPRQQRTRRRNRPRVAGSGLKQHCWAVARSNQWKFS